jgi:site-specific recombinase XerD
MSKQLAHVIRYRKPHTLRHTYASLLIENGESLAYVRDQLGHHSIKLTVKGEQDEREQRPNI